MEIIHSGNKISGTYGEDKYSISGTISGNRLTGTYNENGDKGSIELNISSDGMKFTGRYGTGDISKSDWNSWNGERERMFIALT
jgi:hypothetical protein